MKNMCIELFMMAERSSSAGEPGDHDGQGDEGTKSPFLIDKVPPRRHPAGHWTWRRRSSWHSGEFFCRDIA